MPFLEVGRWKESNNDSLFWLQTFISIANIYVSKDATGGCSWGTRTQNIGLLDQSTYCR